jgi:MFS family permease
MVCPRCGIDVSEQQKFCHDCGAPIVLPEPSDDPTEPVETVELPTEPVETIQPPTEPFETIQPPTEPFETVEAAPPTETTAFAPPTEPIATTTSATTTSATTTTAEMPALFDGQNDLTEFPPAREPFRFRMIFLLALFGAAAMLMTMVADVIDIRTTRPAAGITTGVRTLEDLGSDLGLAGFIGAAVMVIGGLLACFGLRWGAGLAGGAGLALAGWAGLTIGLAELPIAIAESITRTSSIEFTLRVTRDLGWWLIAGVGVIGAGVFVASLRSIGSGGRAALNPLVAAITAVAMVVLAFGPLVPVNDAAFADNFRSVDPTRDLPAAFFAGRLGQVALIALAGVAGMLIVRSYGIGLAVGGITVPLWLWIASLGQIGPNPVGIAERNPGADDTVPHAVTTVGMVASLVLLVLAAALATYRLNRRRRA